MKQHSDSHSGIAAKGRPIARLYAGIALGLVGRAFAAASRIDPGIRSELSCLPAGADFALRVHPGGPSACLASRGGGILDYVGAGPSRPSVLMRFQNFHAALGVLTFSKSAFQVYAKGGLAVSGDLRQTMAIIRALGLLETLLLPRILAAHVLKRVPPMTRSRKHLGRLALYLSLAFYGPKRSATA